MKRFFIMVVVVCAFPAIGHAQIPLPSSFFGICGQVRLGNDARQYGQRGLWLEYTVFTVRDVNTCPISVAVEAHVPGVAGSGLSSYRSVLRVGQQANPGALSRHGGRAGGRTNSRSGFPSPVVIHGIQVSTPSDGGRRVHRGAARGSRSRSGVRLRSRGGRRWNDGKCAYPNCSADRRHRPRRLQADERRQRRPLRPECRRRARAGRLDAARFRRCVSGAGSQRQWPHR